MSILSQRHSRHLATLDSEDDTHIYETPKYLRREKAATLRLTGRGGGGRAQSQCYEGGPPGGAQRLLQRRSVGEAPAGGGYSSRTLPHGSSANNGRRS